LSLRPDGGDVDAHVAARLARQEVAPPWRGRGHALVTESGSRWASALVTGCSRSSSFSGSSRRTCPGRPVFRAP